MPHSGTNEWLGRLGVIGAVISFLVVLSALGIGASWVSDILTHRQQIQGSAEARCADTGGDCAIKDLPAQVRAATAAEAIVDLTVWQVVLTMMGVIVGGATMGAAIFAAKFAKEAADHTDNSAKAAWAAVENANLSSERQLRAYLNIHDTDPGELEVGKVFTVQIEAKNTGATPAHNVAHSVAIDFVADPIGHDCFEMTLGKEASRTTVGPGAPYRFSIGTSIPFPPENVPDLLTNAKRFIVWGEITYLDAFGRTRSTKFRYLSRVNDDAIHFSNHPIGNVAT